MIYSLTEKKIGSWIDSKPLYTKTYQTTIPTQLYSNIGLAQGFDDIDTDYEIKKIINAECLIEYNNHTTVFSNLAYTNQSGSDGPIKTVFLTVEKDSETQTEYLACCSNDTTIEGKNCIVTVYYTKKSDYE